MSRIDPAWLDLQYNNRARIPEHPQIFERWAKASALAREQGSRRLDLRYGQGPSETLDLFPSPHADAPVLVFIHGGWWRSLDKSQHSLIAPAFKNEGACVVIPNYALCPAVTVPDITMQMVKALAWTYRNIKKYGGDPSRITVVGHSAGGHLAAMLLTCIWPAYAKDLPTDLVKGAMSISGLYDLEPIMHTPFLQESLRLTPEQVQKVSPALLPAPKKGVLYTVVGADESPEFLRHNQLIQTAWGKKTVPVCESIPGRNHFSVLEDLTAPWSHLHQLAMRLVFGKA
jgi:arylformamidase